MLELKEIPKRAKVSLFISCAIMLTFFTVQTCVVFGWCENSYSIGVFGYSCILLFIPFFAVVVSDFLKNRNYAIDELKKKNSYLEHAAKIIRHDMHSGINTYLPRGINSLVRRVSPEQIKTLKIESPIRMIREGLKHTQKIYKGVYEFTNLVKQGSELSVEEYNVHKILNEYLSLTSYKSQIILNKNLNVKVRLNEPLFCTAVDNLIRNGLKYNDSPSKVVKIYRQGAYMIVEDNGRGMSQGEYNKYSKEYTRDDKQKEKGSGLGLNISKAILDEHGFSVKVEKMFRGKSDFEDNIDLFEEKSEKNPKSYVFKRERLEKLARLDNYEGKLVIKRGGRNSSKIFIIYEEKSGASTETSKGTKIKINLKKRKL